MYPNTRSSSSNSHRFYLTDSVRKKAGQRLKGVSKLPLHTLQCAFMLRCLVARAAPTVLQGFSGSVSDAQRSYKIVVSFSRWKTSPLHQRICHRRKLAVLRYPRASTKRIANRACPDYPIPTRQLIKGCLRRSA